MQTHYHMEFFLNRLITHLIFLTISTLAPFGFAQSFPILQLTNPTYPADVPELSQFEWVHNDGTLTRAGDLNNDGIDDLLVLFLGEGTGRIDQTKTLWLYTRNADGSFNQPNYLDGFSIDTLTFDKIQDIAIHDHNHDGQNDILFLAEAGSLLIPWINTNTQFVLGQILDLNMADTFGEHGRLQIEDLDKDGIDDYLIYVSNENIYAWFADAEENYTSQFISNAFGSFDIYVDILVADADNDGDNDLIIESGESGQSWIENSFGSYIQHDEWSPRITDISWYGENSTFADVNADGLKDIVFTTESQRIEGFGFYLAPFDVTTPRTIPFTPTHIEDFLAVPFITGQIWAQQLTSPGDIDGDGTDDLVMFPEIGVRKGWLITDPMNINNRFSISQSLDIHGLGSFDDTDYDYDHQYNYQEV
tara:strand:- start:61138 stop:62394 length:1257 start_codon:yes stop_codon:yes gene_type:complete